MQPKARVTSTAVFLLIAAIVIPAAPAQQAKLDSRTQATISQMLKDAHDEVKKNYYDPNLQGIDWDARYQQYSARIATARNLGEGLRVVAAFLSGLNDSHTFFMPPERPQRYDSGYRTTLIGDDCYITQVRPKTDAESMVHPGDRVMTINGFNVNRKDFHDLTYALNYLSPQPTIQLELQSPSGERRKVVVNALVRPTKRVMDLTEGGDINELIRQVESEDDATRSRIIEVGDVAIWRIRQFDFDANEVLNSIKKASKHQALIIDLRGNQGGSVDTLQWIVGSLFDQDIKIADRVGRRSPKPTLAKHISPTFTGKLIVLVDSASASASELLARVVQLQHRGTVIGDKTAGAVMEARHYSESLGADTKIFYGFSVTDANLIMSDGQSLERTGVSPDELILPTAADLAGGRDPVLARAAELAGLKLDPTQAHKMFPFEWVPF